MKKILTAVVFSLIIAILTAPALQASNISVVIVTDDEHVRGDIYTYVDFPNQQPVIINGVTLVPVRPVFEALGFEVEWSAETRTVVLVNFDVRGNRFVISIGIGDDYFTIYDDDSSGYGYFPLDVQAQIINGSTMIPLRPVLEALGYGVEWYSGNNIEIIAHIARF